MNWTLNRRLVIAGLALALALFVWPLIALAQQEVLLTGQDSTGNTRIVLVDSNGRILTNTSTSSTSTVSGTHGACTNTTLTIGTTGAACPTTQLSNRASILIELVQAGETLTVTTDGTTATATVGVSIPSGGFYSDTLAGSVAPSCRCTAASCSIRVVECP